MRNATTIINEKVIGHYLNKITRSFQQAGQPVDVYMKTYIKRTIVNLHDDPAFAHVNKCKFIQRAIWNELCKISYPPRKPTSHNLRKLKETVVVFVGLHGSGKTRMTREKHAYYLMKKQNFNKEQQDVTADEEKQWDNLPMDVKHEILKCHSPLYYMNFRAMRRILGQLAFRDESRTTLFSSPVLMHTYTDQHQYNLTSSSSDQNLLIQVPDSLKNTAIQYSDHGWVLMSNEHDVYLYNPFTTDVLSYSSPDEIGESLFFTSEYFRLFHGPGYANEIFSIFSPRGYSPVFFHNAYYCLDVTGSLVKTQPIQYGTRTAAIELVVDRPFDKPFDRRFLVECNGELVAVYIDDTERRVRVYKFDSGLRCKRVRNLGPYSLYLSKLSSFSIVASPGEENKIYFPWDNGCGVVVHSLSTGGTKFFKRCHDLNDDKPLVSFWIKPSCVSAG